MTVPAVCVGVHLVVCVTCWHMVTCNSVCVHMSGHCCRYAADQFKPHEPIVLWKKKKKLLCKYIQYISFDSLPKSTIYKSVYLFFFFLTLVPHLVHKGMTGCTVIFFYSTEYFSELFNHVNFDGNLNEKMSYYTKITEYQIQKHISLTCLFYLAHAMLESFDVAYEKCGQQ